MCTKKDFEKVFDKLAKEKELSTKPMSSSITFNISQIDFEDAIDRLVVLGFASRTRFLNGNESAEITKTGEIMNSAIK